MTVFAKTGQMEAKCNRDNSFVINKLLKIYTLEYQKLVYN